MMPGKFHIMVKPRGAICNLGCKYCYYLTKESLYHESDFRMSEEILEEFTRQYITANSNADEIVFSWQGGEPTLMGLDFFEKAVRFQSKYTRNGQNIQNTFQTNGIVLDDNWCQFFKANNFLVGLSVDGPSQLHDVYRLDKAGKPTFDRVMTGLEVLKKHKVPTNALTTVHAANAPQPLEVYHFLRDELGMEYIQFIPIVELENQNGSRARSRVTNRSVSPTQYGQFLTAVFDEWVHRDVGQVFVQIFDVALASWLGQLGGLCIFSPTCGTALALEHNGDVYSCDHFVDPKYLLGNLLQSELSSLATSPAQIKFGLDKKNKLPKNCLDCDFLFACHGGCPKNRFESSSDRKLNYLCKGYKMFFDHINEPMRIMAYLYRQNRAPSDILNIL